MSACLIIIKNQCNYTYKSVRIIMSISKYYIIIQFGSSYSPWHWDWGHKTTISKNVERFPQHSKHTILCIIMNERCKMEDSSESEMYLQCWIIKEAVVGCMCVCVCANMYDFFRKQPTECRWWTRNLQLEAFGFGMRQSILMMVFCINMAKRRE